MYGKGMFRLAVGGVVFLGVAISTVKAVPPLFNLVSFNQVEADTEKTYTINESNGPYMIMATSFSGEGAEEQANTLVMELRKRFKLPAYVYKKRFELTKAQGRGFDQYGEPVRMRYRTGEKIEEVAVLVGDYPSIEDSQAQKALKKIKFAKPTCLELKDGEATHQSLAGWRMTQRELMEMIGSSKKEKGPMGHAMIVPNPLLPPDFFTQQRGIDPFLVDLNKDLEYSLLKCPGKYTVQVATFKGQVYIKPDEVRDILSGQKKVKNSLVDAANKATILAQALRMKGYEAYEFHDRHASIVTIGSFSSIGMPLPDGRIELNPKILAIMKEFGAKPRKEKIDDPNTLDTELKSVVNIPLDIQPIPVLVPKVSISTAMNPEPVRNPRDFIE